MSQTARQLRSPPAVVYDSLASRFVGIDGSRIKEWAGAYPSVDVTAQIKRMAVWLQRNPTFRPRNGERFIVTWLGKEQQRIASKATQTVALDPQFSQPPRDVKQD